MRVNSNNEPIETNYFYRFAQNLNSEFLQSKKYSNNIYEHIKITQVKTTNISIYWNMILQFSILNSFE